VPQCLDGSRSFPPEDCGGIRGYENFLKAVQNQKHKEHGRLIVWAGGRFNPEEFDLKNVNSKLGKKFGPKAGIKSPIN
jgi:hypothetical protein